MSVLVSCPNCSVVTEYRDPAITHCGSCGAAFPDQVRIAATRALAQRPPLLLRVAMVVLAFYAAATLFGMVAGWLSPLAESTAPRWEVRLVVLLVVIATMSAAAYALLTDKRRSRPLIVVSYVIPCSLFTLRPWGEAQPLGVLAPRAAFAAAVLALLVWYLYGKKNVVAYYGALEK